MLISHDAAWCDGVAAAVSQDGYNLEYLRTGSTALKVILERKPDLGLLDLDLSDIPGLSWLQMLRRTEPGLQLPVIAFHDARTDELVAAALSEGADDYILKSCHPQELKARLRAVLRRRLERDLDLGSELTLGPVSLDPGRHLCMVAGKPADLRPREFQLLEVLMRKAGRVLGRPYLLESIWGMSRDATTRTVDVAVSRLRRALGARAGRWIETVERYGYRYRSPLSPGR